MQGPEQSEYKRLTVSLFFRFPVVAMGVLKWVDWTVSEPRYFQLQTDHTPIHLALLDEVRRDAGASFTTPFTLINDCILSLKINPATT